MSAIDDKRNQHPWLGNPKDEGAGSDEGPMPDGRGRTRDYDNGSIYWTPEHGAFEIHGLIRVKWAQLGGHRSFLGYPVTDELGCPDGVGRFNHFEGGSIYWTPDTGAHEVHGAIRGLWAERGWETGPVGYPTSDEMDFQGGRMSQFQRGQIIWDPTRGARIQGSGKIDD